MKAYEVAILTTLLALWPSSSNGSPYWPLQRKLVAQGYNDVSISLGISKLLGKELIQKNSESTGDGDEYFRYCITPKGIGWLTKREDKLELTDEIPF